MAQITEPCTHDRYAPYWAIALVVLVSTGISTTWIDLGDFWKGYVLDMAGPAWTYILFRGLYTKKTENTWTRLFTPIRTLTLLLLICAGIELAQYFNLYEATYDPRDFLAYASVIVPLFIIDKMQNR